jgi:hypothetical protein
LRTCFFDAEALNVAVRIKTKAQSKTALSALHNFEFLD